MNQLALKLQAHTRLQFPDFPEDDDFADWVAELAEADGYYVGIAQSLLGNRNVGEIDFSHLDNLKSSLISFSSIDEDEKKYQQCVVYLKSIEDCAGEML